MKKTRLILLAALLCLLAACNRTAPAQILDYFPLTGNVHLVYQGEGNEYAEFETYVDYQNNSAIQLRQRNPGTTSVSVYVLENGMLKKVYSAGETYFRINAMALREEAEIMLKEPLQTGTSWTLSNGSTRSITAMQKKVTVPSGTFNALEITTVTADATSRDYYAPGIGLILREFMPKTDPNTKISSALLKMETDVPLEQTVRFYYPDFDRGQLVYLEQTVRLFSNDEIYEAFTKQMQQVPQGSGLQPLLSKSASVLGVRYDRESGLLTVDLSAEFVSDMNAGTTLESMLLNSVANTFGNYFQTDRVAITIAGKPYASGHILFEEGEYLTADWQNIQAWQTK
ncbi:MAG: GerMN domain-containing protein [Negativicutes bacterium]|nr:GerMN domain-containing protein [Negativicutes bacterium]